MRAGFTGPFMFYRKVSEMFQNQFTKEYPYLYETHFHTSESSACGRNTAVEMVRAAKKYGYTGVFITDHHYGGNTRIDRSLPWDQWVDEFFKGYENAKAEGDLCGLQVFFAYEACFNGTEFLIYGVTKEWMKAHPELAHCTIEEQYALVHEGGGYVIHAHPFREEPYIPEIRLFPEHVDGVEAINATHSCSKSLSHNKKEFDDRAIAYAKEHGLPMTAGSDLHSTTVFGGGVAFKRPIVSGKDYVELLKTGDYMLTNGDDWFDSQGTKQVILA